MNRKRNIWRKRLSFFFVLIFLLGCGAPCRLFAQEVPTSDGIQESVQLLSEPVNEESPDEVGAQAERQNTAEQGQPFELQEESLEELLVRLAAEQGMELDESLTGWLLATSAFDESARKDIYSGLMEDPQRLEGLLSSLSNLRAMLEESRVSEGEEEAGEKESKESFDSLEKINETPMRRFSPRSVPRGAKRVDDPYIRWTERRVSPAPDSAGEEIFRRYRVETSFETVAEEIAGTPADIVLVIDNSRSAEGALSASKAAALEFINQPEMEQSGSRIALVTFSTEAELMVEMTEWDDPALAQAIASIEIQDMSNLQAGLLMARRALAMKDGDVYDAETEGRNRSVVLFTKGMPNYRYTDIWKYRVEFEGQNSTFYLDIDSQEGAEPAPGEKRWSYADSDGMLPQRIYMDGTKIASSGIWADNTRMAKEAARLEAQYLVSQGVDIYMMDYGAEADYLKKLTFSMETRPLFGLTYDQPPYQGQAVSSQPETSRYYTSEDPQALSKLGDAVWETVHTILPEFTLTDQLEESFEFVPGAIDSIKIKDQEGNRLEDAGVGEILEDTLVWTLPEDLPHGRYSIVYDIRVKDDKTDPMRFFPDGEKAAAPSRSAFLEYPGCEKPISFALPDVSVPPLLQIAADQDIPVLAGGSVDLKGKIIRGNGDYTYAWYNGAEMLLDSGPVPLEGLESVEGDGLEIPVPSWNAMPVMAGQYLYYLEVVDHAAFKAGYSGGKIRLPIQVTAVDVALTIQVLGVDGKEIPGQFEVTIRKQAEGGQEEQYHYMGLGEVTYRADNGLTCGQYEVGAYAPYGYRVASQNQTSVEIALQKGRDGSWQDCHETVVIQIEPTRPKFFFGWWWDQ